jgi:hypothetical protein
MAVLQLQNSHFYFNPAPYASAFIATFVNTFFYHSFFNTCNIINQ